MAQAAVVVAGSHRRGRETPTQMIQYQLALVKDAGTRDGFELVGGSREHHIRAVAVELYHRGRIKASDIPRVSSRP